MVVLKKSKLDLWLMASLKKKELNMMISLLLFLGILPLESLSLLLQFLIGNFTKWMLKLLFLNGEVEKEVYIEQPKGFIIHCDNQRFINISNNMVFNDRSKHIEMRYKYV
jgi:hypothetical protein